MPERAAADIRVITFNTAVGNPAIATSQRDFLRLPFYREVMRDAPGAPLLALQEVGPEQAEALRDAAANGSFALVHISRPGQGNALLIPRRYTVLAKRSRYFVASQLRALAKALGTTVTTRARLNVRQYLELRMWSCVRVRDSVTGRELTVFNTHLSGEAGLRLAQAAALLRRVHRAGEHGPVVLAGDLNVRAEPGGNAVADAVDAAVRARFAPLQDMAAAARDPRRPPIDWILAQGFEPVSARLYTDGALALPGIGGAEEISDHHAREAVLRLR